MKSDDFIIGCTLAAVIAFLVGAPIWILVKAWRSRDAIRHAIRTARPIHFFAFSMPLVGLAVGRYRASEAHERTWHVTETVLQGFLGGVMVAFAMLFVGEAVGLIRPSGASGEMQAANTPAVVIDQAAVAGLVSGLLTLIKWTLILGVVGSILWGIGSWLFAIPSWAAVIVVLLVLVVLK